MRVGKGGVYQCETLKLILSSTLVIMKALQKYPP